MALPFGEENAKLFKYTGSQMKNLYALSVYVQTIRSLFVFSIEDERLMVFMLPLVKIYPQKYFCELDLV